MATTTETKKAPTPMEAAIAKAEAKPGLAVKVGNKFIVRNKTTGKTYRIEQVGKRWHIVDNGTNKVLFSKDTKHHIRRIAKDWTKATEGTGPADAAPVAKTPATAKNGSGDGKGGAKKPTAITINPKKADPAGAKAAGRPGPIPGDTGTYKPAAGSGSYAARVIKVGPNKVQVSVQFKKGDRPMVLWVERKELTVRKAPAPVAAAKTAAGAVAA
jgi:hypothetical protein